MPAKFEWFKWFPKDAETDEDYVSMTHEEVGFYHRCLNRSWINGGLPSDPEARARALKTPRAAADRLWKVVGRKFIASPNDDERLTNARQEEERSRAADRSRKASNSARGIHSDRHADAERTLTERIENVALRASGSSCSSEEEYSLKEQTTPEVSPGKRLEASQHEWFEQEFWPEFWRKVGKEAAWKAFQKHALNPELKDRIVAAMITHRAYYLRERDLEHRPHASTWLNGRRYNEPAEDGPAREEQYGSLMRNV